MNDEQIKKIIDSPEEYDDLKEESYISMAKYFYRRTERWAIILLFAHFFFFLAFAVVCALLFFGTGKTKYQIMYAALFVIFTLIAYLIKVFGWVWGSRHLIQREIKKLELRIAELTKIVKEK